MIKRRRCNHVPRFHKPPVPTENLSSSRKIATLAMMHAWATRYHLNIPMVKEKARTDTVISKWEVFDTTIVYNRHDWLAVSSLFQQPAYWALISVIVTVGTHLTNASLSDTGTGSSVISSSFPIELLCTCQICEGPSVRDSHQKISACKKYYPLTYPY